MGLRAGTELRERSHFSSEFFYALGSDVSQTKGRIRKDSNERSTPERSWLSRIERKARQESPLAQVGVEDGWGLLHSKTVLDCRIEERRVSRRSAGSDLGEQIRVTIQQLEQFDQGQRRLGLAVLVARKSIDATAKDFGGLALPKV